MPWIPMAIGAAVMATAKTAQSLRQAAKSRDIESAKARYGPWTGSKAQTPKTFDWMSPVTGGVQGAMMGSGVGSLLGAGSAAAGAAGAAGAGSALSQQVADMKMPEVQFGQSVAPSAPEYSLLDSGRGLASEPSYLGLGDTNKFFESVPVEDTIFSKYMPQSYQKTPWLYMR